MTHSINKTFGCYVPPQFPQTTFKFRSITNNLTDSDSDPILNFDSDSSERQVFFSMLLDASPVGGKVRRCAACQTCADYDVPVPLPFFNLFTYLCIQYSALTFAVSRIWMNCHCSLVSMSFVFYQDWLLVELYGLTSQ